MNKTIYVISGAPGVGKTTTIETLVKLVPKSVHISIDKIRGYVKNGYKSPDNWSVEMEKQYTVAREGAAYLAKKHSDNGFCVFVDDVFRDNWKRGFEKIIGKDKVIYVYLREDIEKILKRNAGRSHSVNEEVIKNFYEILENQNTKKNGWIVIDNKDLDYTINEISKISSGAIVWKKY
jgi:tRNA uridine 5-carbamoylmethylation protein Kti12